MTYYGYRGDFANRFTVAAFSTAADRDEWLSLAGQNELAHPLTRKEARHELGDNRLSPHDEDMRTSIGCYVGSRDQWKDDERRQWATDRILVKDGWIDDEYTGKAPNYRDLDVCDPPIRL